MNTQKINSEDALYAIQKTSRDDVLEAAKQEANTGFTYATAEEVSKASNKVIDLFKPTLDELKNR